MDGRPFSVGKAPDSARHTGAREYAARDTATGQDH